MAEQTSNPVVNQIRQVLLQLLGIQELDAEGISNKLVGVPKGVTLQNLEYFQDAPNRIRGSARIHDYKGFINYVNTYKTAGSRIFVNPDVNFSAGLQLATCYFDYPEAGKPSWTTHSASLLVQPSLEYKKLIELNGKLYDQVAFARYVNDLDKIITSMNGAELLELAQSLTLTSKGDFASLEDDLSGSIKLKYDVQVKANAGTETKKIDVPQHFTFNAPVLLNGAKFDITADFHYRIPEEAGGKIKLGISLPDKAYLERDVLEQAVASLASDTGLSVIIGTSEVPEFDSVVQQITAHS